MFRPEAAKINHLLTPARIGGADACYELTFATSETAEYQFIMPQSYDASMALTVRLIISMSAVTTGNVGFTAAFATIKPGTDRTTSRAPATGTTVYTSVPTILGTVVRLDIATNSANRDDIAAGDLVRMRLLRADALSGDTKVLAIEVLWQ
jgi:hypothetical protein